MVTPTRMKHTIRSCGKSHSALPLEDCENDASLASFSGQKNSRRKSSVIKNYAKESQADNAAANSGTLSSLLQKNNISSQNLFDSHKKTRNMLLDNEADCTNNAPRKTNQSARARYL